jgi:two-component system sensor kinase FixL
MSTAASLMLAAVYLFIWIGDRRQIGHLAFSTLAVGIAAFTVFELAMMHASSPAHYAILSRWIQVPTWVMIVSVVWFTRAYLRAGRAWLGWTIVGLRTLALLVNFSGSGSITFREGTALEQVLFFGEPVFIPVAAPNPWMVVPHASVLLLLLFLVDACIWVWRRGERRLALIVGGTMVLFTLQGLLQVVLVLWGFIAVPTRISWGFLIMLIVMALEISRQIRLGMQAAQRLRDA